MIGFSNCDGLSRMQYGVDSLQNIWEPITGFPVVFGAVDVWTLIDENVYYHKLVIKKVSEYDQEIPQSQT